MLKSIDQQLAPSSQYREALTKSALALHHAFINGYRKEIEDQFNVMNEPLSSEEIANLKRMVLQTQKGEQK